MLTRRSLRVIAMACAGLGATLGFGGAPVAAEVCPLEFPRRLADARGYTWIGTVTEVKQRKPGQYRLTYYTFDVERVYQGGRPVRPGRPLTFYANTCRGVELEKGARYLYSTSLIEPAGTGRTLAWKLHGSEADLIEWFDSDVTDPRLVRADTLREALALMVPGALPDTDATALTTGGSSDQAPVIQLSAGLLGLLAAGWVSWSIARRRRRAMGEPVRGEQM
ncbi:MAG: hypothetical protein KF809_12395 [Chloroflexi bacterium]|nr:hypothetical protein [Chloroflexota bacterium]